MSAERSAVRPNAVPLHRPLLPRHGSSGVDGRRRYYSSQPLPGWAAFAIIIRGGGWRHLMVGHRARVGQILHWHLAGRIIEQKDVRFLTRAEGPIECISMSDVENEMDVASAQIGY